MECREQEQTSEGLCSNPGHFYLANTSEPGRKMLDLGYILRIQVTALGDRLHVKYKQNRGV